MKNTHHLKDTNIEIYEEFMKETMATRKSLWDEVKKLQQQGKYALIKYDKIYSSEFRTRRQVICVSFFLFFKLTSLNSKYGSQNPPRLQIPVF